MRYQNLKSFQKHLASAAPHHLCRVYLISIPDDFERSKVLDEILSYFPPDSSASRFSGADLVLSDLFEALQTMPLFGGESIVLLDEVEKIPKKQLSLLAETVFHEGAGIKIGGFLLLGSRGKTTIANGVEKEGVVLDLADEKPWDMEKRIGEQLADRVKNAGKRIAPDVAPLLLERLGKDAALLESEIDKLICYVGDRPAITKEDVLQISPLSRASTLWQMAEELIWEGQSSSADSASFHALVPALRSQLQLGLTLSSLIDSRCPSNEWGSYLPKLWPKILEKRSSQAAKLGSAYFRKGLEKIFEIELLSRTDSTQYGALYDFFRAELAVYASQSKARG